jgi:hypothetical protein
MAWTSDNNSGKYVMCPHTSVCIRMYHGFQYLLEECFWKHLLRRVRVRAK